MSMLSGGRGAKRGFSGEGAATLTSKAEVHQVSKARKEGRRDDVTH